jgi:hypothetical protein
VVAYINSNINIAGFHSFSLGSRNRNKERRNSQDEHNQPKGEKQFQKLFGFLQSLKCFFYDTGRKTPQIRSNDAGLQLCPSARD